MRLGFEVGFGEPVEIPLGHMAVTGQTQASGKTTTLEALASRVQESDSLRGHHASVLAFVTKRGERAFAAGRRVSPYFRDRADWQFVTSIIDATLQEKNKFLRPWIMRICRTTRTLAEVQREVRKALKTAKGINEGVYTQLDAYLDLIVPEIQAAALAPTLALAPGLNVMDVSQFATPMQMLFIQSAIDWVNEHETRVVVIVPEAWEFIPEGKGSPVKHSAIALVRKGAALGNFIWVDSQDMAGVDKTILRGCGVWLIGVQREANEIRRNLANIPKSIKQPTAAAVAMLERGQFFACYGPHLTKTYVWPSWMPATEAQAHARGEAVAHRSAPPAPAPPPPPPIIITDPEERVVNESEARALREENARLRRQLEELQSTFRDREQPTTKVAPTGVDTFERAKSADAAVTFNGSVGAEELYQAFKKRLIDESSDPAILRVLMQRSEIQLLVKRAIIEVDGDTLRGYIAKLITEDFFDKPKTTGDVLAAVQSRGGKWPIPAIANEMSALTTLGFFTKDNKWYKITPTARVNVVEEEAVR